MASEVINFSCKQCHKPLKLDVSFTSIQPHTLSDLMAPTDSTDAQDVDKGHFDDEIVEATPLQGESLQPRSVLFNRLQNINDKLFSKSFVLLCLLNGVERRNYSRIR